MEKTVNIYMIKENKITKEVTVTEKHRYCDECGKELHWSLACSRTSCEYCGKDLCEKCIGHEEFNTGDYRDVWCKECWDKGEKYRSQIEHHENEVDRLYIEWRNECKTKC